jgi:hypothetical protein
MNGIPCSVVSADLDGLERSTHQAQSNMRARAVVWPADSQHSPTSTKHPLKVVLRHNPQVPYSLRQRLGIRRDVLLRAVFSGPDDELEARKLMA